MKPDARIIDLLKNSTRPLLSYEFFPPRDDAGLERLLQAAKRLLETRPDFVTCTWGAGGSTRALTLDICTRLRDMGFGPVMPHLTCVGASRDELNETADEIYDLGFRNIMTLRGDPPKGESSFKPHPDGLRYASELVALLKERHSDFCCGVAGYPEQHPEAPSLDEDIQHLKEKIDAGGDFITTQLFFDNRPFLRFVTRCREVGIHVPVVAGLLPAMSLKQVRRFTNLCGSSFPLGLSRRMELVGGEGPEAELEGIYWARDQIEKLVEQERCAGIHLYVLNRSKAAVAPAIKAIFDQVRDPNAS